MKQQLTQEEKELIAEAKEKNGITSSITIKFHKGRSKVRWVYDKEDAILIINTNQIRITLE